METLEGKLKNTERWNKHKETMGKKGENTQNLELPGLCKHSMQWKRSRIKKKKRLGAWLICLEPYYLVYEHGSYGREASNGDSDTPGRKNIPTVERERDGGEERK